MSLGARSTRSALSTPGSGTKRTRFVDGWFLLAASILVLFGLLSLFSIDGGGSSRYFLNQCIRIVIGFVPALLMYWIHPKALSERSWVIYGLSIASLLAVLAMGSTSKGAQRWLELGPFEFQPSEMAKLFLAITLAAFYANRKHSVDGFWTYVLSLVHVGVPTVLVFFQPHLGGAVTLLVIWLGVSLIAGVPWKYLAGTVAVAGLLILGAYKTGVLKEYQLGRIKAFLMGQSGDKDMRYHQDRALIAFGSGGVSGQGFLKGENRGTGFVPEQQTDYISTVIGEEGGLVGSALLLSAFGFFFYRLWLIMFRAADAFHKLVIAGMFSYLAFHMVANLGMNLEMLPVVGLWLPFLSFGGTAIWLCMASVGLAMNIRSRETESAF